jgi:hypothetical protein
MSKLDKYFIYIINNKKGILLASSNSKTELREMALEKIGDKIKKYDGLYLYRVKISKTPKKMYDAEANSKIKIIGGPWVANIERIQINSTGNKTKLTSIDTNGQRIYFTEEYMQKYKTIKLESITETVYKYAHNKFSDALFAINTVNN